MKTMKIFFIVLLIIPAFFSACSLIEGISRDNPNDPSYEGSLTIPGTVTGFSLTASADSISVSWDKTEEGIDKAVIYWDTVETLGDTAISGEADASVDTTFEIPSLAYGTTYYVWLRLVDTVDEVDIYSQDTVTASAVVEPGGILESDFGVSGMYTFADSDSYTNDIVSAGGGEFYVGGDDIEYDAMTNYYNIVYKLDSSGNPVSDFAVSGKYTGSMIPSSSIPLDLVIWNTNLLGFRYYDTEPSATLYAEFENDFTTPAIQTPATAIAVRRALVTDDNDVIVCGSFWDGGANQFTLKNLSGDLMGQDYSFSSKFGYVNAYATDLVISGGHLYVAGYYDNGAAETYTYLASFDPVTMNFENSLVIDGSWNNHGTDIRIAATPDGDILIAGYMDLGRFDPSLKTKDDSFGTAGLAEDINSMFLSSDLMVQPNGKILLAGTLSDTGDGQLYRFNTDGTLDNSFAVDGIYTDTDFEFNAIDVLSNGRIVIAATDSVTDKGVVIMLK